MVAPKAVRRVEEKAWPSADLMVDSTALMMVGPMGNTKAEWKAEHLVPMKAAS